MPEMQLDHVVVLVPSLAEGVSQFTDLGFEVMKGGQHASTENALIVFEDQTYIELLALKPGLKRHYVRWAGAIGLMGALARTKTDINWRLLNWVCQAYGSIDWCLRVDDVDQMLQDWSDKGIASLGSQSFSRTRLDGAIARWRLGSPKDLDLPFLLRDISDTSLRIAAPERPHPNGALGIRKLWLAMSDPQSGKLRFDACFKKAEAGANQSPAYALAGKGVELVTPDHHAGKIALELKGPGPSVISLDPAKTYNMSISIVPD